MPGMKRFVDAAVTILASGTMTRLASAARATAGIAALVASGSVAGGRVAGMRTLVQALTNLATAAKAQRSERQHREQCPCHGDILFGEEGQAVPANRPPQGHLGALSSGITGEIQQIATSGTVGISHPSSRARSAHQAATAGRGPAPSLTVLTIMPSSLRRRGTEISVRQRIDRARPMGRR